MVKTVAGCRLWGCSLSGQASSGCGLMAQGFRGFRAWASWLSSLRGLGGVVWKFSVGAGV